MEQIYFDLLVSEYRGKSSEELLAMLDARASSPHQRNAARAILRERRVLPENISLAIFLTAWPWIPLLMPVLWVYIFFATVVHGKLVVMYPLIGTLLALFLLPGKQYYRLAISSGAIGCLVWAVLPYAFKSGALGNIRM